MTFMNNHLILKSECPDDPSYNAIGMTLRELLEPAAKAAGIDAYWSTDGTIQARPMFVVSSGGGMGTMPYEEEWNPCKNDCQALQLAVKLRMVVDISDCHTGIGTVWAMASGDLGLAVSENIGDDTGAATRRAIVRAAAKIGMRIP